MADKILPQKDQKYLEGAVKAPTFASPIEINHWLTIEKGRHKKSRKIFESLEATAHK